jgi:hypothetical protein
MVAMVTIEVGDTAPRHYHSAHMVGSQLLNKLAAA